MTPVVQRWSLNTLAFADVRALSEALAPIHTSAFGPNAWSAGALQSTLSNPITALTWIENSDVQSQPLGFALWQPIAPEAELLTIAVHQNAQGCGLGKQLLIESHKLFLEDGVEKFFLEVREDNKTARNLYNSCGYQQKSRRADYYLDKKGSCDALVMVKDYMIHT